MGFLKKEVEHKTAEEYRAIAEEHKQAYKNQWKTFFKSGIIVATSFVVIIALAMAWYVNNSRVDIDGVNVSADNESFELRSYGKNGVHDDILESFFAEVVMGDGSSPYTTSSDNQSINWLMSDSSNIGNYSQSDISFNKTEKDGSQSSTDSNTSGNNESQSGSTSTTPDRKDYAIEPGSEGRLTFYIVPGIDGTQTISFNLDISPYIATTDVTTNEITDITEVGGTGISGMDVYARQFMSGHILFFLESDKADTTDEASAGINAVALDDASDEADVTTSGDSSDTDNTSTGGLLADKTYTWIKDNTFSITIPDAVAGEEYAYTIYWKWPQVFSEIVLNNKDNVKDPYLVGRSTILSDELRDEVITDMVDNPQNYFYNSLTKKPLKANDELVMDITNIHSKSPKVAGVLGVDSSEGYNAQNFVDLSSFYNQADQIIGSRISFIIVELTGELVVNSGDADESEESADIEESGGDDISGTALDDNETFSETGGAE